VAVILYFFYNYIIKWGKRQDTTDRVSAEIAEKLDCEIQMYRDYGHAVYEEAGDFIAEYMNSYSGSQIRGSGNEQLL